MFASFRAQRSARQRSHQSLPSSRPLLSMPFFDEPGRHEHPPDPPSLPPSSSLSPVRQARRRAHDEAFDATSGSSPSHKRLRRLSVGSEGDGDSPMPREERRKSATNPVGELSLPHPDRSVIVNEVEENEAGHGSRPSPLTFAVNPDSWSPATLSHNWSLVEAGGGTFPPSNVPTTTAMSLSRGTTDTANPPHPSLGAPMMEGEDTTSSPDISPAVPDPPFPGAIPYSRAIFSQAPSTNDALKLPFSPDSPSRGWARPSMSSRLVTPNPSPVVDSTSGQRPAHNLQTMLPSPHPVHSALPLARTSAVTPLHRASLLTSWLKPQVPPSLVESAGHRPPHTYQRDVPHAGQLPPHEGPSPSGAATGSHQHHTMNDAGPGQARPPPNTSPFLVASVHTSPLTMPYINPYASTLARDALMTYAYRLYHQARQPPPPVSHGETAGFTSHHGASSTHDTRSAHQHPYITQLIPLLNNLENLHPRYIPIKLLMGCAQYVIGDFAASIAVNEEILRQQPDFVESMSNIGTAILAQGRRKEAESWWQKAINLKPTYWDAFDNLIGSLCHVDRNHPGGAAGYVDAIEVCDNVRSKTTRLDPQSGTLTPLPSVSPQRLHRLQGLLYTSANLRLHQTDSHSGDEIRGVVEAYLSAVDIALSPILSVDSGAGSRSTRHECYCCEDVVIAVCIFGLMANHPSPQVLRDLASAMGILQWPSLNTKILQAGIELLAYVKRNRDKILPILLRLGSGVLPTVMMTPQLAARLPGVLFPSSSGILPGICQVSKQQPKGSAPASFEIPGKELNEHTHRLTSSILLTLAKVLQTNVPDWFAPFQDSITASPSLFLLIHYVAFGFSPEISTCNNIGILLATSSASAQISESSIEDARPFSGPSLAELYYQHGLTFDPEDPHLLVNLGSLAKDGGDLPKAMHLYAQVLKKNPNFAVAHANMGNVIRDAGSAVESIPYYRRAVSLDPNIPEAVCGLASALTAVCDWRLMGGIAHFAGAPRDAERLHTTLGPEGWLDKVIAICGDQIRVEYDRNIGAIRSGGDKEQWLDHVRKAYGDADATEEVVKNWANALDNFYRPLDSSTRILNEGSFVIQLIGKLVQITQHRWYRDRLREGRMPADNDVCAALEKYPRVPLPGLVRGPVQLSVLPFNTFTYPLPTRMTRVIAHRQGIGACYGTATSQWLPNHVFPPPSPPHENQLHVGFVSSDFNNHPLTHLMQSTFGYFKHKAYCYATSESDGSQYRTRIEGAHSFIQVSRWSTKDIIERILADGIHILINLNGYTKGARNDVFAARPCPIQIAALGYPGTLGAGWIDYLLCDSQTCPPHVREIDLETNRFLGVLPDVESPKEDWIYTEKMIYMPHTYFVTDHKQSCRELDIPTIHAETSEKELDEIWEQEVQRRAQLREDIFPDLPKHAVIFANFNQAYKALFAVWLHILQRVPGSILWLLRFPAAAEEHLLRTAREWAGPEVAARVVFTDVAKKEEHIRRCRVADISLDTLECNAHTVAADVIWSGTPLVTWPKDPAKMCSRVASSIVMATGFGEKMIVSSLEEYEERAVSLAASLTPTAPNAGEIMGIRKNLFLSRDRMPLFDTERWVRNFEKGLEEAWKRWETGTDQVGSGCIWVEDAEGW
ncbi:hypothetical protein FRB95_010432 [Tulasnella sp. JGI-2019a]|nr:hypothetical protein FRB95_010432 [Tulasnella sp. JGI-2019a]